MLNIIQILGLVVFAAIALVYLAEAWQASLNQVVLCVLLPFYLFYFALIKSRRDQLYRFLLIGSFLLVCLSPVLADALALLGNK